MSGFVRRVPLIALAAVFVNAVAAAPLELLRPRERVRRLEEMRPRPGGARWNLSSRQHSQYDREIKEAEAAFGLGPRVSLKPSTAAPKPGAKGLIRLDPAPPFRLQLHPGVREAQQHLAELGYLDATVDVDGKFGPRTLKAIEKFQQKHGFPVTGDLDAATADALPVERLKSNLAARYRLLDGSGLVHYWGDSQRDLGAKLREILSAGAGQSAAVELEGFSQDKAEALAASLRLQQRQIDPSVSIAVLPHFAEDPGLRENLFTRGIKLERTEPKVETIASGSDAGKLQSIVRFTVRVGNELRAFTIWIVAGTAELITEFVALISARSSSETFDEQHSVKELVDSARAELMAKHPGLTREQFRLKARGQFVNIDLGLLRRELLPA